MSKAEGARKRTVEKIKERLRLELLRFARVHALFVHNVAVQPTDSELFNVVLDLHNIANSIDDLRKQLSTVNMLGAE